MKKRQINIELLRIIINDIGVVKPFYMECEMIQY